MALLFLSLSASPGLAQIPGPTVLEILLKNTLAALNQANLTGNYTVLRDLGAPDFRAQNNASRLAEIFSAFRQGGIDLSPLVVLEPQFLSAPALDEQGRLQLVGHFPTQPIEIRFNMTFQLIGGTWLLADISVDAVRPNDPPVQ